MMTHRICSGGTRNAAAMDGNAMFTMESRETTTPPAAAIRRVIACMMARRPPFLDVRVLDEAPPLVDRSGRPPTRGRPRRRFFLGGISAPASYDEITFHSR